MKIVKTIKKMCIAATNLAAAFSVALCLRSAIEICLCDPDPDDCGEHCHDCGDHSEDKCLHLTVDVDDFLAPQTGVSLPAVSPAFFSAPSHAAVEFPVMPRLRPSSTAPPDSGGGRYISYYSRMHPLS